MSSRLLRTCRHLLHTPWQVQRQFPDAALDRIEAAVAEGEKRHSAELRLAIEGSLSFGEVMLANRQPRDRALELFSELQVWDTEANNGVLVYLLLADKDVEVLADRGAAKALPERVWQHAVELIRQAFISGRNEEGVINAVQYLNDELAAVYPPGEENPDELPNRPAML